MAEENKSQPRGITKIGVDGFKSLRNADIEIRPLTILAGANSSGKSAIMQPLLLMKQTLEAVYDTGSLLLSGENAKFTSVFQFLPMGSNRDISQSLRITLKVNKSTLDILFKSTGDSIDLAENRYPLISKRDTTILPKMPSEQIRSIIAQFDSSYRSDAEIDWQVSRKGPFLDFFHQKDGFRGAYTFSSPFQESVTQVIHVPGLRGTPERTNIAVLVNSSTFTGRFDKHVAGILNYWHNPQYREHESNLIRLRRLSVSLKELGLTNIVKAELRNAAEIEIRVGRTLTSDESDLVSIADVGFGVSQVLPVLVALLVAEPGQLVYIEQPELHLHPRAQHKLAEFIAEAANRGVRVVIETHSDILLLGVQTLVAKGKLSPDNVILHWFQRGNDGLTKITSRELDEDGAYGDWPEDFADVDMDAQSEYLDTVAEKHLGMTQDAEAIGD